VSFSPALKWVVLLLLVLTLGWKVTARYGAAANPPGPDTRQGLAEFLRRQHFQVSLSPDAREGEPSIKASAGSCRLLIAESPPLGWNSDLVRHFAAEADRVFVLFQGQIYAEQPTWMTVPSYLWGRFRRELGFRVDPAPVFAVIASPVCDAERLPWPQRF